MTPEWLALLIKSRELLDAPVAPTPPRDPLAEDVLEKWASGMPSQPEPEPVKPEPPIDIHAEISAAVEAALLVERDFLFEVMGEALGESLRDARKESADELAAEVRLLWQVVSELQATTAALTRIGITGKTGEVIDLPALPSRREGMN